MYVISSQLWWYAHWSLRIHHSHSVFAVFVDARWAVVFRWSWMASGQWIPVAMRCLHVFTQHDKSGFYKPSPKVRFIGCPPWVLSMAVPAHLGWNIWLNSESWLLGWMVDAEGSHENFGWLKHDVLYDFWVLFDLGPLWLGLQSQYG